MSLLDEVAGVFATRGTVGAGTDFFSCIVATTGVELLTAPAFCWPAEATWPSSFLFFEFCGMIAAPCFEVEASDIAVKPMGSVLS